MHNIVLRIRVLINQLTTGVPFTNIRVLIIQLTTGVPFTNID